MKKKKIYKIIIAVIIVAAIFFFWRELWELDIQEFILGADDKFRSVAGIFILLVIKSIFFFLPGPLLYTFSGMLLSPPLAFLIICGALFINFSLTYIFGFLLGYDFISKIIEKNSKLQEIFSANLRYNFRLVFLLRLLPFPLEPISIALGSSGIKYWKYIIISLLGMTPKLLIYLLIGHILIHSVTIATIAIFLIILFSWLAAAVFFKNFWH